MNKEDVADRICAIAYPCRIHKDLFQIAKGSGLVIVYGASDSMGFGKRRVVQGVDRRGNAGLSTKCVRCRCTCIRKPERMGRRSPAMPARA